jgi:hypothetical protein
MNDPVDLIDLVRAAAPAVDVPPRLIEDARQDLETLLERAEPIGRPRRAHRRVPDARRHKLALAAAAAAVVMLATVGLGGWLADRSEDAPSNVATGPEPMPGPGRAPGPDRSPGPDRCRAAGPEPTVPDIPGDLASIADALEQRFPSCFGGIGNAGPFAADVWVVGEDPAVLAEARRLTGPRYTVTMLPSDHAVADVRALKRTIDADRTELHDDGIITHDSGITIEAGGPRVLIGISPYSAEARAALEERYGADWLIVEDYGEVIPGG